MTDSQETLLIDPPSTFKTIRMSDSWQSIKDTLQAMADGLLSSAQILSALSQFKSISYNDRFGKPRILPKREFSKLREGYYHELPNIFTKISRLMLVDNSLDFPLFKKGIDLEHTFKKKQVQSLLCSMVLCLIAKQQYDDDKKALSFGLQLDFSVVFDSSLYKTRAIMEYLKEQLNNSKAQDECLTIKRRTVKQSLKQILQAKEDNGMCPLVVKEDSNSIEDHYGDMKVDFANSYIGGGALGSGCVQQQIMFANHPQLHVSQLLCEQMGPNESILLTGFKKYSINQGYSYQTKYAGKQKHQYEYDGMRRAKEYIVAIDALFLGRRSFSQYRESNIKREIFKAYCGFSWKEEGVSRVATGNWGCGAFGGNIEIKFIIQWIACSLARKEMVYCPFGSKQQISSSLIASLKAKSIADVYHLLLRGGRKICNKSFLRHEVKQSNKQTEQISIFKQMAKLIELNST